MRYLFPAFFMLLIAFASQAQVPSYVPTSGLVAWYPLDGNLNDVSGSGNNAVAYGSVVYGSNRYGIPLSSYNGSGLGEGDVPGNNFPTGNSARTISVFYKYKLPYAGGGKAFFGWGNNIFGGRFNLFAADAFVGVEYVNGYVRVASYTVDSCWHNLTATYPSTGGGSSAVKLYLDGYLVATSVYLPISSYNTPSGPWHGLGGNIYYLPAYSDSWTGYLDDIGVWNRELTAAEVLQLWTGGGAMGGGSAPVISGTNSLCQSSSATLTATPAGGAWSTSNASIVSVSGGYITGLSAGTAVITYSIVSGCTALFDTQSIVVTPLPVASVTGSSNLCVGSSATFTGAPSGGTWTSSNPSVATINTATGLAGGVASGSAIISYTVSNSCGAATDTQMVTVTALPLAGVVSGPPSLCVGTAGLFSSTSSGGTWTSSVPSVASINSSSGLAGGAAPGSAIISYTVTNSCGSATDTQMVSVIGLPSPGIVSGPSFLCPGSTGLFTSGVPSGVWSSSVPAVATINSASGLAGGVVTGSSIISYTVTNACGSATDTQMVTVSTIPFAGTISGPSSVCVGASVSLTGVVSGGTWSSSNPGVATVVSGFSGGVSGGTAIISYTLTNSCGTATDTQMITVLPLPAAGSITGPLRVCIGAQITLSNSSPGGTWSSVNTLVATVGSLTGVVSGVSAGTTLISYSVSNACGTLADTQTIAVLPLPDAGIIVSAVPVACVGGAISVTDAVTGGVWSSSAASIATVDAAGVVSPLSAGTVVITYTITDDNGCTNYAITTLTIPVRSPLIITPDITQIKCNGDNNGAISITVSGGSGSYQYLWTNGSTSSSLSALGAGSYDVEVTDAGNGCKDTGSYMLTMPGIITPELTIEPDRCNAGSGSVAIINVSGGNPPMVYAWSSGSVGSSLAGLQSGNYVLTITDANLCVMHYNVVISEDSCDVVVVHNAVTPNGDGYNDLWIIDNIENYPNSEVKVFDKWGDEVFAAKGYKNNWGGGSTPDGTYFYLVKFDDKALKGNLLIKR